MLADIVEVVAAHRIARQPERARDGIDDRLDRQHPLRPAIAAEGGVGDGVGAAGEAAQADVGQPVAVVGVAQGARDHGRRVVGDVAAVRREGEIERQDAAVRVEADVVADQEGVALAGGEHVVVAG